jgi:hypothetical protein
MVYCQQMALQAAPTLSTLRALECELHEPKARRDAARLGQLLHADFHEFGHSGRSYTRAEIFERLQAETEPTKVHAQDFQLLKLAEAAFLLTYRSAHVAASGLLERHTNRASVWRHELDGWQMVFHQGTPTDGFDISCPPF